jgi:hypothetical protein
MFCYRQRIRRVRGINAALPTFAKRRELLGYDTPNARKAWKTISEVA